MTTKFSLKLISVTGKVEVINDIETFEFMQQGFLFIKLHPDIKKKYNGDKLEEVKNTNERLWIPIMQIRRVSIITDHIIKDETELRKYEKFLEHGIDMTVTPISYTAPKNPEEVAATVDQELKLEEKEESKDGKR